jgi:acyl-CoA thioester hydrolase
MSEAAGPSASWELKVRYYECDMQGVVFNANYYAWADQSVGEFFRKLAGGYDAVLDEGVDMVVAASRGVFHAPVTWEQILKVTTSVARLGNTSLELHTSFERDGEPIADIAITYVMIDRHEPGNRKREIPPRLRELLDPAGVWG